MAPWITSGDTYTCSMSVEVRADSRLSSSSAEAELSVELKSFLKLLENRLAILSEPVTLSTTGDGNVFFCYQKIDALQTKVTVRVLEQCLGQLCTLDVILSSPYPSNSILADDTAF